MSPDWPLHVNTALGDAAGCSNVFGGSAERPTFIPTAHSQPAADAVWTTLDAILDTAFTFCGGFSGSPCAMPESPHRLAARASVGIFQSREYGG